MLIRPDMTPAQEVDWLGTKPTTKRTRAKIGPELVQQRAVVPYLRQVLPLGSKVAALVNEQAGKGKTTVQRGRFGQARKKSGVLTGLPDLVCILPGGGVLWIEMKAPKNGKLSVEQDDMHTELRALGHVVGCATCIETARWLLHEWAVPLREAAGQPMRPALVRVAKPKDVLPRDRLPL